MIDGREYGEALFLLTEEKGTTEAVLADVKTVAEALDSNPAYRNLADTPAVATETRVSLVGEAFSAIDNDLCNLLKILCEKHSLYLFGKVAAAYSEFYDASRHIERVTCVTAVPMTEAQIDALKNRLSGDSDTRIIINNIIDNTILGGMKLRYKGKQLDGSLKSGLERLGQEIRRASV